MGLNEEKSKLPAEVISSLICFTKVDKDLPLSFVITA